MAKGRERIEARRQSIALLGKSLARRASRRCELCDATESLHPYDLAPKEEPSLETLLLLCPRCQRLVDGENQDPRTLRFLEGTIWSEVEPISSASKTVLRTIDSEWARETLEMVEG